MAELSNAGPFLRPAKTVWRTFAILRTKSYQTPVCKVVSGASQRTGGRFRARPIWRRRFQHRSEATEGVRGSFPRLAPGAAATAAGENSSSPPVGRRWKLADILKRFRRPLADGGGPGVFPRLAPGGSRDSGGGERFKSTDRRSGVIQTRKKPGPERLGLSCLDDWT